MPGGNALHHASFGSVSARRRLFLAPCRACGAGPAVRGEIMRLNNMLVLLVYGSIAFMQVQGFVFAGLSLRATINELRTKYPLSLIIDQRVYLSDAERHDDISTIELSGAAGQRTLMLSLNAAKTARLSIHAARRCVRRSSDDTALLRGCGAGRDRRTGAQSPVPVEQRIRDPQT